MPRAGHDGPARFTMILPPKRSEVAATLLWWGLAWEYDTTLTERARHELGRAVVAWQWWLDLGYPGLHFPGADS